MSVREHQDMRARHADLMFRAYGIDHDSVAEISREIEARLFDGQCSSLDENGNDDSCPSLDEVMVDAAELDARLRICRPWYQVFMYDPRETLLRRTEEAGGWSTFGMVYDEALMVDMEGRPLPSVALVVSPALVKRGNAKGDGYDKVLVLARRQVLCCGPRDPCGPDGSPHTMGMVSSESERDANSTRMAR
jgi:hypothetical protein